MLKKIKNFVYKLVYNSSNKYLKSNTSLDINRVRDLFGVFYTFFMFSIFLPLLLYVIYKEIFKNNILDSLTEDNPFLVIIFAIIFFLNLKTFDYIISGKDEPGYIFSKISEKQKLIADILIILMVLFFSIAIIFLVIFLAIF